ncbi:MAG TPA: iron-containing alcohol dehydrogenase [Streptosporangiaceae bacterium]|nr:iron-containing alcohol dehydrogenase [Streptosporangiaceae bacterium]
MLSAPRELVIGTTPAAYFGAGSIARLPDLIAGAGGRSALIVTDSALAATGVIGAVTDVLAAAGVPAALFTGVHPNPTTADLAAGAAAAAALLDAAPVVVAVGGGSPIDAAKGITLAAVNPQRGRELDYRSAFAARALPLLAVPTTAGTGAETNAFGVVTDEHEHRKFYVGHASTMPAAAVLDPELTTGLPPAATAATGMDALTHALESYLSVRANPWSAGIALQVVRMVSEFLPRAVAAGSDAEARGQMLLAAHMAGVAMASTGLGACHAIGHALGGRFNLMHGVALTMVLPQVLSFCLPVSTERLAELSYALGAGDTAADADRNASAAISAIASLAESVGMTKTLADFAIRQSDFAKIAADALDDEVLANAPLQPTADDITQMLAVALGETVR